MDEIAWPDYIDIRFYATGWTFRIGTIILRWNSQGAYTALSLEHLRSKYASVGGMTWREFRIHRKQERETSALARLEAEAARAKLEIVQGQP